VFSHLVSQDRHNDKDGKCCECGKLNRWNTVTLVSETERERKDKQQAFAPELTKFDLQWVFQPLPCQTLSSHSF
jgi:hypothetical protein